MFLFYSSTKITMIFTMIKVELFSSFYNFCHCLRLLCILHFDFFSSVFFVSNGMSIATDIIFIIITDTFIPIISIMMILNMNMTTIKSFIKLLYYKYIHQAAIMDL